jgi:PleD family two-component response regulator
VLLHLKDGVDEMFVHGRMMMSHSGLRANGLASRNAADCVVQRAEGGMRAEYPDLAGITVLVDDDAETRKVIRAALNHAGADTMCAASGTEALQQLDRRSVS